MSRYVLELRNAIKKATPLLKNLGDAASRQSRKPGGWKALACKPVSRDTPATLDYYICPITSYVRLPRAPEAPSQSGRQARLISVDPVRDKDVRLVRIRVVSV